MLESDVTLGAHVLRLVEEAAAEADNEPEHLVTDKKPLDAALKELGITGTTVAKPGSWAELKCADAAEYRQHTATLFDPENMAALASRGWVPVRCGEESMSFEPGEFKVGFVEISTAETSDSETVPDAEGIRKAAQAAASKKATHDDTNPVDFTDKSSSSRQKGIGDTSDGKQPEGKPKGASKQDESTKRRASHLASKLLDEMTSASAVPAVDSSFSLHGSPWSKKLSELKKRKKGKPHARG